MHVLIVTGVAKCCTNLNFQPQFTRVHLSAGSSVPRLCQYRLVFILSQERSRPLHGRFLRVFWVHFPLGALPSVCWRNTVGPQEISPSPTLTSFFVYFIICATMLSSMFYTLQLLGRAGNSRFRLRPGGGAHGKCRPVLAGPSSSPDFPSQPGTVGSQPDGTAGSQPGQHDRVMAGSHSAQPQPSPEHCCATRVWPRAAAPVPDSGLRDLELRANVTTAEPRAPAAGLSCDPSFLDPLDLPSVSLLQCHRHGDRPRACVV